ncbi:hypothetical protein [Thermoplasma sp. Kam2015]|uniref:hypothetical protein n=1 Tax=Thermoplasma sp. Kam2015 TaxID=2094122 RepID=UPI000DA109B5|nr:hypothetical protein [Thermoplasma sp. Kam2015]
MITLRDSSIQSKISLLFQMERPYTISANDPGIMDLVDYDLSEAERHLEIWMSNHPDDCLVEGKNPLTIRIYPTFFEDPEQKLQRDAHKKRMRRFREGRWPEQRPYRREWQWK